MQSSLSRWESSNPRSEAQQRNALDEHLPVDIDLVALASASLDIVDTVGAEGSAVDTAVDTAVGTAVGIAVGIAGVPAHPFPSSNDHSDTQGQVFVRDSSFLYGPCLAELEPCLALQLQDPVIDKDASHRH